jgi:N-ethylmaleimide reductase
MTGSPRDLLRPAYTGTLLAVGGFTRASGEAALAAGRADVIVYGRPFIANPDLVERFRPEAPLNQGDVRTYYGGDDDGYTDYATLSHQGWRR